MGCFFSKNINLDNQKIHIKIQPILFEEYSKKNKNVEIIKSKKIMLNEKMFKILKKKEKLLKKNVIEFLSEYAINSNNKKSNYKFNLKNITFNSKTIDIYGTFKKKIKNIENYPINKKKFEENIIYGFHQMDIYLDSKNYITFKVLSINY